MSSLISVVNKSDQDVRITMHELREGGRERYSNGAFTVSPGKSKDVLIDEDTSFAVDEVQPQAEVLPDPAVTEFSEGDAQ